MKVLVLKLIDSDISLNFPFNKMLINNPSDNEIFIWEFENAKIEGSFLKLYNKEQERIVASNGTTFITSSKETNTFMISSSVIQYYYWKDIEENLNEGI